MLRLIVLAIVMAQVVRGQRGGRVLEFEGHRYQRNMQQYIGGKPFHLFRWNLPDIVEKRGCVRAIHE